jgi:hypothetical protein
VQSDRYFHPELGYFCPAPRLRRELRVACYASLFGVAVGAATVVVALSWTDRAADSASPLISAPTQPAVDAVPRQLASTERNDLPKPAATQASQGETMQRTPTRPHELSLNKERPLQNRGGVEVVPRPYEFWSTRAAKARSHANQTDNGPDIARVPLGRPAAFENATPSNAETDPATPAAQDPAGSSSAAVAASATPRTQAAPAESPRAASVLDSKPHRMVGAESRPRKQPSDSGNALGNVERAYARDNTLPRTVFWDWSR